MGFLASTNDYKAKPATFQKTDFGNTLPTELVSANGEDYAARGVDAQQSAFAKALFDQMQGKGPTVAQNQLQAATDANIGNAAAFMAAQRGMNPALAARMAERSRELAQQQSANQSAQLRAQEMLAAQGQLGNALSTQRGQDISQMNANTSLAGTVGGLQQQQNALDVQTQQHAEDINAGVASQNAKAKNDTTMGFIAPLQGASQGAGAAATKIAMTAEGGRIPGKAHKRGDSYSNDTVPAMLSPGEIVLPRSVTQSADAPERAKAFVAHIEAKEKAKAKARNYGEVLKAKRFAKGGIVAASKRRK